MHGLRTEARAMATMWKEREAWHPGEASCACAARAVHAAAAAQARPYCLSIFWVEKAEAVLIAGPSM